MITLKNLSLRYGQRTLYDEATATINTNDRIALVGSNGTGKTTLLKVLNGEPILDSGKIAKAKYATVGYLPQDGIECRGKPLYEEVESASEDVLQIQANIDQANADLDEMDPCTEEYSETLELLGEWDHRLAELDVDRLKSKIEKVLLGLGFSMEDMNRDTGEFSGGWQMRIALAKLLLREPTLLLLDEPTNHLDLPSQRWLERYLKSYEGSLVMISHDQAFLDSLCKRIFELSMGKLTVYEGNYSFYEREKAERKAQLLQAYKNQQRMLEQQKEFINRFRSKASKAKQVQSRIKQLEKVELIEIEKEESEIHFNFPPPPRSGQTVLELKGVKQAFREHVVLNNLSLRLERGDKVGVVGVNGAGKSTLMRILAGVDSFVSGERKEGRNASLSYFAQHQADELDPNQQAIEALRGMAPSDVNVNLRSVLGAFLFKGDDAFKKVSVLSGGEKNRLALARMLLHPCNCLILDEPTNHLDIRSKRVLQKALKEYTGTFVIVSHDRSFLDPVINKVWEISPTGLRVFKGSVTEYLQRVEAEQGSTSQEEARLHKHRPDLERAKPKEDDKSKDFRKKRAASRKEIAPLRKKTKALEGEIEKLEGRYEELKQAMLDPEFFKKGETNREAMLEYDKLRVTIDTKIAEWEGLSKELSEME